MKTHKSANPHHQRANPPMAIEPTSCRCGGTSTKPELVVNSLNRWIIRCEVKRCFARNIGQGLNDTIAGWNRLSTHFYR